MTQALDPSAVHNVAFRRLQALVNTGYRPSFGRSDAGCGVFFVSLTHPRASKRRYVPRLALWNDGILATDGLLWPEHYVPSATFEVPAWQQFILAEDGATFERFVSGVHAPSVFDLYVRPAWKACRSFTFRFLFGSSLCVSLAGTFRLIALAAGAHAGS